MKTPGILVIGMCFVLSCQSLKEDNLKNEKAVSLITLDPGHFHAALVQKFSYADVDSMVHVYAPPGPDVELHLNRINAFNSRKENPTSWDEQVYRGEDFFEKMLEDKRGNLVVISGNNQKKPEYIKKSIEAGFDVLADKPMVIDRKDFETLLEAFTVADDKGSILYDIMTERYEITTMLQREVSMIPEIFGTLEKGSADNPAVTKESVHHFYKYVSGSVLTRPAWFMDVEQQGEGIVDVTTHLVDLIQWECFPEQIIDTTDIHIVAAKRWPTLMTLPEFTSITKLERFPDFLNKNIVDSTLHVYSNGEIRYTIKGVHARVSVRWAFKAPEDAGDTHYSIMRGTKANLVIRQGAEQNYKPTLYIEPASASLQLPDIDESFKKVEQKYPGVTLERIGSNWKVVAPERYHEGHEAHFTRVTEKFLQHLKEGDLPDWEVPNMITKYYTTTKALEVARKVN